MSLHAQATLDVAQAALLDQSEEMRQVTAERDTLLLQLQRGSISPTASSPRQEDSISAYHIDRHNSQLSVSGELACLQLRFVLFAHVLSHAQVVLTWWQRLFDMLAH